MKNNAIKLLLLTVAAVLLAGLGTAQTANYSMDFKVVYGKIVAEHQLAFAEPFSGTLGISLPADTRALAAYSNGQKIELEKDKTVQIPLTDTKQLRLEYITEEFFDKAKGKSYFLADLSMPLDVEQLSIKLTLPKGAILDRPDAESVWPKPTSIETDGQRIFISWQKQDMQKDSSIALFVIFKEEAVFPSTAIAVALIAAAAIVFLFFYLKRKKKEVPHLLESERVVIEALKKAKGEIWQKQIQIQTGFSKAKLSRVIRDLEARGLIKRIPIGNTNKIRLI